MTRHAMAWSPTGGWSRATNGLWCSWPLQEPWWDSSSHYPRLRYQSQTSLEVQGLNENFLNLQNLNPTSAPGGYVDPDYEIKTQVKVLQSRSLVERAIERLRRDTSRQYGGSQDKSAAFRKLLHMAPRPAIDRDNAI